MITFQTPAKINDFDLLPAGQRATYRTAWHELVNSWLDEAVRGNVQSNGDEGLFYNPNRDTTPGNADVAQIGWDAFPQVLLKWFENQTDADTKRWQTAETLATRRLRKFENGQPTEIIGICHRQQDEYCEWFVDHDQTTGKIKRITFTSEGPEYWEFLAQGTKGFFEEGDPRRNLVPGNKELVTELYQKYVNANVRTEDLFWNFDVAFFNRNAMEWELFAAKGDYNPNNKWNTTHGCMHLTHPANTLRAEVNLAADGTVLRRKNGVDVVNAGELICCSGFGGVNRSSDPSIGSSVNEFSRQNLSVSLADPIGLYISDINLGAFIGPNGENVDSAWHIDRGSEQMILRARFELPENSAFTIDDIKISGLKTSFGGQIADHIQMVLNGLAKDRGIGQVEKLDCSSKCCSHPQKPDFKALVQSNVNCGQISSEFWQNQTPTLIASPLCGGSPAGFEETPESEMQEEEQGKVNLSVKYKLPTNRNAF